MKKINERTDCSIYCPLLEDTVNVVRCKECNDAVPCEIYKERQEDKTK